MIAKYAIACGLLLGATLPAGTAAAAPVALDPTLSVTGLAGSLVAKAQWRYCRYWRHECARRWGWGDYGFRRCLWRHGC